MFARIVDRGLLTGLFVGQLRRVDSDLVSAWTLNYQFATFHA